MFLVELTEKELDLVVRLIEIGILNFPIDNSSYEENKKNKELLKSISEKINNSVKPKKDVLITINDFINIKSTAIGKYQELNSNLKLSKKDVSQKDLVHISFANSLIMWLNSKSLLKNLVGFDYTDDSYEYEETE